MSVWTTSKLMDLVQIETGKKDANEGNPNGQYRFYTCAKDFSFIDDFVFDKEAILISGNGAYVGYVHYYKGKFDAYQRTYILSDFKMDVFYLFHYLAEHLKERIHRQKQDNATPYITKGTLAKFRINHPENPAEQSTIASILSKVDEAITASKNSIAKAERLKKALMQNLLTGKLKLDGTWRKENEFYKDEKFGSVPLGWKIIRLDTVFFVNQNTLSSKTKPDYTFNYITIESAFTERIEWGSVSKEIYNDAPSRARRIIKDGDILLSTVRPNLKSFLIFKKPNDIDGDWICSTGFGVLTAKEKQDRDFYFYQILSEIGEKQFYSFVSGTNYPAINDRDFKKILFYEAPYDEQILIGKKITKVSYYLTSKQNKVKKLERLKKALMQNLLTGKVRVKVTKEQIQTEKR
jgi:hypothetical protein